MEQQMEEIIKQALLNNKPGAYTLIVSTYYSKIMEVGNKYFITWFCKSLEIEEDLINYQSFRTALYRYNKKRLKENLPVGGGAIVKPAPAKDFIFSDPASGKFKEKNEKGNTERKSL